MDSDGTGSVTMEEYKKFLPPDMDEKDMQRVFDVIDANKDGKIDQNEFESMSKPSQDPDAALKAAFKMFDSNNDGEATLEEYKKITGITDENAL